MTTINPIIPWLGGKRRVAELLIKRLPKHECYVEVFAGSAAVFFARYPAKVEVLNDINGDLVNLYRVVANHLDEFMRQFQWAVTSRQVFSWLQATDTSTLTDIQRASRFFYLQHHAFGGKVDNQHFGTATTSPSISLSHIRQTLAAAHARLAQGVCIEHIDWSACIERYDRPHTLFYLDPPYWQTEGYGVPFAWPEYVKMAEIMRNLQGKAVLSLNDHPEILQCFKGYDMEFFDIDYTVGGGENKARRSEVIIYSWDTSKEPCGLF